MGATGPLGSAMIDEITTAAVVISLLFLGWQSREVARQTRLANQTAGVSGLRDALTHLDSIIQIFIEYPELRPYFYGGVAAPTDARLGAQVDTVAELLADCIEVSLEAGLTLDPFASNLSDWQDYCQHALANSPALRALVTEHPAWYPRMAHQLGSSGSQ